MLVSFRLCTLFATLSFVSSYHLSTIFSRVSPFIQSQSSESRAAVLGIKVTSIFLRLSIKRDRIRAVADLLYSIWIYPREKATERFFAKMRKHFRPHIVLVEHVVITRTRVPRARWEIEAYLTCKRYLDYLKPRVAGTYILIPSKSFSTVGSKMEERERERERERVSQLTLQKTMEAEVFCLRCF